MNTLLRKPSNITSQRVYAFSVLVLLAFYLLGVFLPMRVADLDNTYGVVFICMLFGVYLSKFAPAAPVENKVYLVWIAWMLVTRWLNGDIYLFVDFKLMLTCVLGFLFVSAGTVLDKKGREIFLDVLSLMYAGFALVMAVLGIFVFITNTYIHIPPENVWVTIRYDGTVFAPNYFSIMRLAAAFRLLAGWGLLVYQFVKRKNKLVRAVIFVCLLILFVAISLCHSRATQMALMAAFALIALLISQHLFRNKKRIISITGSAALALIFAFGSYFGNDVVCKLITNAHNTVASAFAEYYNGLENKINEEYFGIGMTIEEMHIYEQSQSEMMAEGSDLASNAASSDTSAEVVIAPLRAQKTAQAEVVSLSSAKEITANDHRKLSGNWNFTGRTWIWHSGIVSIIRDPIIAVKGLLLKQVAPTFNAVMAELYPTFPPQINMHNAFMQVLMLSGLPGLIMVLIWTVLLVIKMVKIFFAPSEKIGNEIKILTVPLAAPLVLSLAETLIFTALDINAMVFYLCVGAFLGYYYDSYPVKTKN